MSSYLSNHSTIDILGSARQIADYAENIGIGSINMKERHTSTHIGAVLADSILQAGVNYRTVVKPRVERIIELFPEAAALSNMMKIIDEDGADFFLQWNHHEKINRFLHLTKKINSYGIEDTNDLYNWLILPSSSGNLLAISGIGPKTVDYLSCLVGIDCVAVDRHVKVFVKSAGIEIDDYEGIKLIVSYAADLLGLSRRGFDSWMWNFVSLKSDKHYQYSFFK